MTSSVVHRALQFPGLINGTTIDWFLPWPEQALVSVAAKFLDNFDMACPDTVSRASQALHSAPHHGAAKPPPQVQSFHCGLSVLLACVMQPSRVQRQRLSPV